jgi:hypothetical protein
LYKLTFFSFIMSYGYRQSDKNDDNYRYFLHRKNYSQNFFLLLSLKTKLSCLWFSKLLKNCHKNVFEDLKFLISQSLRNYFHTNDWKAEMKLKVSRSQEKIGERGQIEPDLHLVKLTFECSRSFFGSKLFFAKTFLTCWHLFLLSNSRKFRHLPNHSGKWEFSTCWLTNVYSLSFKKITVKSLPEHTRHFWTMYGK